MWLVLTAACGAMGVAGHALLCRRGWRMDFVMSSLVAGFSAGAVLLAGLIAGRESPVNCTAALLLYAFAFELYIFLFTLVSSSVSVTLLLTLARRDLEAPEAGGDGGSRSMIAERLAKLQRAGLLRRDGEHLVVTAKSRRMLRAFRMLRQFFRHPGFGAVAKQP